MTLLNEVTTNTIQFLRLSSSSLNSEQTQVVPNINFIIVLSSSIGFTYCY